MSGSEEQIVETTGTLDEPYVVSDERLAEIRAMLVGDGSEWPLVRSGVSREMLAGAIFDFLAERDDAASVPSPPEPAS